MSLVKWKAATFAHLLPPGGCVLISVSSETDKTDSFDMLLQKGIPVVFFDRIREELNTSQVFTD